MILLILYAAIVPCVGKSLFRQARSATNMKLVLHLLTVCALAWTCEAGIQAHDPQTLQTATNLFNWLKGLVGDGSSGTTHPNTEIKYNDNFVTKCPPNIIFVLDGSDSVSPIGFQHAKTALNREIRAVTEAFANADVGVILFSDVTEEIPLKTRSAKEIDDLIKQVDALKQPRRKTSIPTALRRARQNLLDYSVIEGRALNGERSGNIIVLLSDGNPDNQRATIQEAKISKDREILIISLSLEDALLDLLKDISHIVQEYRTAIDWVSLIACPSRILPDVPKGSGCRDVLLVVDGSDSVLRRKEIVRQYLAYTALRYRRVTNAVGVNIYGSDPGIQASNTRLRLMEDKYVLAESIRLKLMFPKTGGTGTDLAVLQSVGMLDDDIRNRPSTLVLITDGPPFDVTATREAIRSARSRGYPVIIIRVGTALTDAVLSEISGGTQENVFSVNSFTDLFSVNFDSALCSNISNPCRVNTQSCRAPYIFDDRTCSCACPTACPYGKTHDSTCTCQCIDRCPVGQQQDSSCNCFCSNTCAQGTRQNFTNCLCERCPSACANGQFQDGNCACVCRNSCPTDQMLDANCNCVCRTTGRPSNGGICDRVITPCSITASSCRYPEVLNSTNFPCACVCPTQCPTATARSTGVCGQCVCLDTRNTYDPFTNRCDPRCSNTCPTGQQPDINNFCACQCTNVCPREQFADPSRGCSCQCVRTCPSGQVATPNSGCNCICDRTCNGGQIPNINQNCSCSVCDNACPQGQIPDPNRNCNCQCPNVCPRNQSPDVNNRCQCTCNNVCPAGQRPDVNNDCNCVCANTCPSGQFASTVNGCQCRCSNTCSNGQIASIANDCRCPPVCSNTCPTGQMPNINNNCQCQCDRTCPTGQSPNINNNCQCQCDRTCPTGQSSNINSYCQCECDRTCPTDQTPNINNNCNCECRNICSNGQLALVSNNCQCIRPNTCPFGQTPNTNGQCQCERTCPMVNLQTLTTTVSVSVIGHVLVANLQTFTTTVSVSVTGHVLVANLQTLTTTVSASVIGHVLSANQQTLTTSASVNAIGHVLLVKLQI
ncbi:unnamed protein product [Lymnaea stagnalis]|uniref:VWFA domain-containing protein n=1 Tax=Lymnaea stagnalis TaxID=6523 RepID=A0AAV2HTI5_LYMST